VSPERKNWEVRLSLAAEADLESIFLWTVDRFGEGQARAYEGILKKALSSLRQGPSIPGSRPRPDIAPGLFSLHAARISRRARHFIFFQTDSHGRIEIVRVLHDGMDIRKHLPPDETEET
jgi:toxin ParE1/3/4